MSIAGAKRLDKVVQGLSPEAKARWVIEGPLLGHEGSTAEAQRMLASLSPEDGRRYNAYLQRWHVLRDNLSHLVSLCYRLQITLLHRDRLLWYRRGIIDAAEAIVFGDAAKPLLVSNPNLKPGRPLILEVSLGQMRLGVWGRKRRPIPEDEPLAELSPQLLDALDAAVGHILGLAAEVKALAAYVTAEAEAMELRTVPVVVGQTVRALADHDRPLLRELATGPPSNGRGDAVFPVEERWALDWEAIEPDAETSERVRKDPKGWLPRWVEESLVGRTLGGLWQDMNAQDAG